jgi:hypothetical protein
MCIFLKYNLYILKKKKKKKRKKESHLKVANIIKAKKLSIIPISDIRRWLIFLVTQERKYELSFKTRQNQLVSEQLY